MPAMKRWIVGWLVVLGCGSGSDLPSTMIAAIATTLTAEARIAAIFTVSLLALPEPARAWAAAAASAASACVGSTRMAGAGAGSGADGLAAGFFCSAFISGSSPFLLLGIGHASARSAAVVSCLDGRE